MSTRTLAMTDPLYDYLLAVSLREAETLRQLREETSQLPMARMQISPEQGQFMALLVQLMGAKRYLEVGVFTGYSSLAVALAMPADGQLTCCDLSEEWTQMARRYWQTAGVLPKVDLKVGPAVHTLDRLLEHNQAGSYDLAFIDADKENYDAYYERALMLVRRGGLILFDNVLWGGRVADPADQDADTVAIRALNRKLHGDPRVSLSILPIGDGLTLALKR